MLPLTLFRSRTFSAVNLLTLLLYAALGGVLFFLSICVDPSAWVSGHTCRNRLSALHDHNGRPVALGGRIARSLRCPLASRRRPRDCRVGHWTNGLNGSQWMAPAPI